MANSSDNLADQLTRRIELLASQARETAEAIEEDRGRESGEGQSIDALIVDSVVSRVHEIAADCDELSRILVGYGSLVGEHRSAMPEPGSPAGATAGGEAGGSQGSDGTNHAGGAEISEGVRLLATQMSVAGSGPAEIARRLRDEFGVENSAALVRELFGHQ